MLVVILEGQLEGWRPGLERRRGVSAGLILAPGPVGLGVMAVGGQFLGGGASTAPEGLCSAVSRGPGCGQVSG